MLVRFCGPLKDFRKVLQHRLKPVTCEEKLLKDVKAGMYFGWGGVSGKHLVGTSGDRMIETQIWCLLAPQARWAKYSSKE